MTIETRKRSVNLDDLVIYETITIAAKTANQHGLLLLGLLYFTVHIQSCDFKVPNPLLFHKKEKTSAIFAKHSKIQIL